MRIRRLFSLLVAMIWPVVAQADDVQSLRYFALDGRAEVSVMGAGTDIDTAFAIASVGKTMTAVAVLRLAERGVLGLDDPAARWVSADIAAGLGLGAVTIRHLLTMTSGLPDYYDDDYLEDALEDQAGVQRAEVASAYAFDHVALFRPGAGFDYSNTNYVLLGLILEQATGQSYARVMQREVFDPAGMTESFVFGSRPLPAQFADGHEGGRHVRQYYAGQGFGDGGVISSARDLARFYQALLAEGRLLSDASLAQMLRDPTGQGYGMGIEVEGRILGHSGGDLGFSSDVRFDLTTGAIALTLMARGDADTDWTYRRIAAQ